MAILELLHFLFQHYAPSLIFVFLVFFHFLPIYIASHTPWTARSVRHYLKFILKIYLATTILYILICIPYTFLVYQAPGSALAARIAEIGECAKRNLANKCDVPTANRYRPERVERECFALGMCLRQPVLILRILAFLRGFIAQFLSTSSFNAFVIMTGGFVLWGLGNGSWLDGYVDPYPVNQRGSTVVRASNSLAALVASGARGVVHHEDAPEGHTVVPVHLEGNGDPAAIAPVVEEEESESREQSDDFHGYRSGLGLTF